MTDIELFAGAGGLALGLQDAGLPSDHLYEWNKHCIATLKANAQGERPSITGAIHQRDLSEDIDWSIYKDVRLLTGGPPCQPFSVAGNHKADKDKRNGFPWVMRAVRMMQPKVVIIENVQGMTRPTFEPYLNYLVRQLGYPELLPKNGETWADHDSRLTAHQKTKGYRAQYSVRKGVLNAADYGMAQLRARIVFIATRADLPPVELPEPTHSREALVQSQVEGDYWERHGLKRPKWEPVPKRFPGEQEDSAIKRKPWLTVRDVITPLGRPQVAENSSQHWIIPGARLYRGHRGSGLDWPSKTIKAGVHGVAGGENIVHLDNGTHRYFTLREMASLQGFPRSYFFTGPRSRVIGQIGNAVPKGLARAIGNAIKAALQAKGGGPNHPLKSTTGASR